MSLNNELAGVTVVSLEQAVAAPYAGLLLADAGARVIKIERPEGDFARGYDTGANGQSAIFAWLNRGKESICLNLKEPQDMALLRTILGTADVFLSNLAPGKVAAMELDGDTLRITNPRLITCTLTGYGETGQAAQKKAYDFLVQAESGVCAVTGTPEAPARVGVSLTDLSTGLTAFSAILRALLQRATTNVGIDLSISMFDVMADWMNMPLMAHRYTGGAPQRSGLQHGFVAPYGAFTCKQGAQVLLSIQNNREWRAFCETVLLQPELVDDDRFVANPERYTNRKELDKIINTTFANLDRQDVLARLDSARIANANLNSVGDVSEHPFLSNAQAAIGGVSVTVAALPVRTENGTPNQVPDLGQHSQSIRAEFKDPAKR